MPPPAEPPPHPAPEPLELRRGGLRIDERWLWRGLDLTLRQGECVAVRGRAGTGKSLLLRRLAALDALQEGEILHAGVSVAHWSLPVYRSRVAYVAQRPTLLAETVGDEFEIPFGLGVRAARALDRARAQALLTGLGRDPGFTARRCRDLSGGERQIVSLVRTLLTDPWVLLLDEPTASLDQRAAGMVEATVGEWLQARNSRAVLWVGHDPAELERVASRSVWIGEGGDVRP